MKILQICDVYQSGGAQSVFRITAKLLSKLEGYEIINACCEAPQAKNYINMYNCIRSNKITGALNYIYSYKNSSILNTILQTHKFDVVHIQAFLATLSPSILNVIKKNKKIQK